VWLAGGSGLGIALCIHASQPPADTGPLLSPVSRTIAVGIGEPAAPAAARTVRQATACAST
jgi:hypothetical protein